LSYNTYYSNSNDHNSYTTGHRGSLSSRGNRGVKINTANNTSFSNTNSNTSTVHIRNNNPLKTNLSKEDIRTTFKGNTSVKTNNNRSIKTNNSYREKPYSKSSTTIRTDGNKGDNSYTSPKSNTNSRSYNSGSNRSSSGSRSSGSSNKRTVKPRN
jgi:hypothetical protein